MHTAQSLVVNSAFLLCAVSMHCCSTCGSFLFFLLLGSFHGLKGLHDHLHLALLPGLGLVPEGAGGIVVDGVDTDDEAAVVRKTELAGAGLDGPGRRRGQLLW